MLKELIKENVNYKNEVVYYQIRSKDRRQRLTVKINPINGDVKWTCTENNIDWWVQELKLFYCKTLLIAAKTYVKDSNKKFNYFLLARSIKNDVRSYAEVTRGLTALLTEEQKEEVIKLKKSAEDYFDIKIDISV